MKISERKGFASNVVKKVDHFAKLWQDKFIWLFSLDWESPVPIHCTVCNFDIQSLTKAENIYFFWLKKVKVVEIPKESTETYLLELTPYKGLCIVVCLLNGQ